jgi:prepilin signal peptidase PulO-like enzyme (type II secretory pathway)
MTIALLVFLGLCSGSFINALVWRLHQKEQLQVKKSKASRSKLQATDLSILKGRSMCPNCYHQLTAKDLVPILSWLFLKRKCRYCKQPISWQYPFVELGVALLFVLSYIFWPDSLLATRYSLLMFMSWLIILVGLVALVVYDIKWMLLPDKIVFPLIGIALLSLIVQFILGRPLNDIYGILWAVAIGGGIFGLIFLASRGKWIGGGDVKLGLLLGIVVAMPEYAFLLLFIASLAATLFSLPLLIAKKLKKNSKVPFGPFLILACIVVVLFGSRMIAAYQSWLGL